VAPVDIAFITANYNTVELVRQMAGFFAGLDAPFTFSFTVVDNNSRDGSREFLQAHPEIHGILLEQNVGYGRAINRGVAVTDSKYLCVTNTDVILNRDALVTLWRFLEEHRDVGVCAPRITCENGVDQGMVFRRSLFSHYALWYAKLLAWHAKRKIARSTEPLQVDGVMGAFFLVRRSVLPGPALFDEDFFFFHEDTALAHTLTDRGTKCFILPNATVVHLGGKSRSESSIEFFYQTKYLYLRKFYGTFHAKAVSLLDRARIFRKWLSYSLFASLTASERIRSKQRYYKMAWNSARLR
jgi:N-acetylglucosaminyl-diphospho-decaprenol L-rhamnosyltransferase